MKNFKQIMALLLALVLLALAACGTDAAEATNPPTQSNDQNVDDNSGEESKKGIDMTFTIFLDPNSTDDPRCVVLKEIVDDYNANNAYGNTVTVESIHWSEYESHVIQATAAGNGPDIANVFSDQLMQLIDAGVFQPMTKYATAFIEENPAYIHTAQKLTQSDGEIYTLPWESRVTVMWYRNDLYEKAPGSWDDLLETASMSDGLNMGFCLGLSEGSNGTGLMETFVPWIRACGGDIFDSEGKAVFNSDAGVQVVEYIKSLVEAGCMDSSALNMTYDDVVDGFKAGSLYAIHAGTQRAATIKSSELASNYSSAPMPGVQEGTVAPAFVAGQTLGIGSQCEDPEMAWDFIQHFYSVENQKKWISANVMPIRTDVYDDPEIQAMDGYEEMLMWSEYATTGTMTFYPADYTELEVKICQAVQLCVFQNADPMTELTKVADWYNGK